MNKRTLVVFGGIILALGLVFMLSIVSQSNTPSLSPTEATEAGISSISLLFGSCTEEQFWQQRAKAADCMLNGGEWINRQTTCRGRCVVPAPIVLEDCDWKNVAAINPFKLGCVRQQSIWFWKPGSLCRGECFWNKKECLEKLIILLEGIKVSAQTDQPLTIQFVDAVTCGGVFVPPDY